MKDDRSIAVFKRDDFWLEAIDAGSWQWREREDKTVWSPVFLGLLGLDCEDAPLTFSYFTSNIIHPEDRFSVEKAIALVHGDKDRADLEVRLLHHTRGYRWFKMILAAGERTDQRYSVLNGCIVEIEHVKGLERQIARLENRLIDAGKMGDFGTWEADVRRGKIYGSENIYELLKIPGDADLNPDTAMALFHPASISGFSEALTEAVKKGKRFDLDLRMITGQGQEIWVRCVGEPVIRKGKVTRLKGILQDIDEMKKREQDLRQLTETLAERSDRLMNFAHIVSHNLRNHSGNLEMIMSFMNESPSEKEKLSFIEDIGLVSRSLSATIHHLTEITRIQTATDKLREEIDFEALLQRIENSLSLKIESSGALLRHDFSKMPGIVAVPAYLESILTNLISNGIKYRHPERRPILEIETYRTNPGQVLRVRDNGLGIDLQRYGKKLFGMYKTFHKHKDSRGIGLFITKNQVEAMGGKIEVHSIVNEGTEFKIIFNDTPHGTHANYR